MRRARGGMSRFHRGVAGDNAQKFVLLCFEQHVSNTNKDI